MNKSTLALLFVVSFVILANGTVRAENLFDASSGELNVPIIRIDEATAFSGRFSLVSESPLVWAGVAFEPTQGSSRLEAIYDASAGTLLVPQINVQQRLYTVRFNLTSNCDASVCLEAQTESVVDNGRDGAAVFTTALSAASTFSCSSCHAMTETNAVAMDGLRRPGHPLLNAASRPSFKNGSIDNLLDAVNICVTEWMNGQPLTRQDSDWVNLQHWLQDQVTQEVAEPLVIDIVPPPTDFANGDAENGRTLFNSSCIVCHGFDGEGTQLAPTLINRGITPELLGLRVRTSGRSNSAAYEGLTGGVMPFWGANRLSDGELIDIAAFVASDGPVDVIMGVDDPETSVDTGCTLTSEKIGQQAVFRNFFHDIAGTAMIIDDCTIEITGFSFDGGGIDTQIYLGIGGEFRESQGGFSASDNLVGIRYVNNTLRITLPQGRTLDDFDSISVWCVPVGVSFGTGFFSS